MPEASGPSAGDGSANYAANSLPLIEGQGETQGLTDEEFESLKTALAALPAAETVQELDEAKQQELYQELLAIEEKLAKLTEEQKAQIPQEQLERLTAIQEVFVKLARRAKADSLEAVYVSSAGDDENGDGTQDKPVASLGKAVELAKNGGTIYLQSDLISEACARFYNKSLTINGQGHRVVRGDTFKQQQDVNRSTYNPALIEVNSDDESLSGFELHLVNITLDDAGKHAGEKFDVQNNGIDPNGDLVQDSIVASYTDRCTIVLEEGATLANYGGMSAVRINGGGKLVMKSGSKITDTSHERTEGAAAVLNEAGVLEMEEGSSIERVTGRAVMLEYGGQATINGTISGIAMKGGKMRKTREGIALFLTEGAKATLGATGRITDITTDQETSNPVAAITVYGSDLTTEAGSVISAVNGVKALWFDDLKHDYQDRVFLDGTIENCEHKKGILMSSWYGHIELGPNSVVQNCSADTGIGIIYSNNGSHYTFGGKIINNQSNGVYLATQGGGQVTATIKDGALISGNKGVGFYVNNRSQLTMEGGEISENTGSGVYIREKDETFIMNGGVIRDNGAYGVEFLPGYWGRTGKPVADLKGGSIYGNKSAQIYVYDIKKQAYDEKSRVLLGTDVVKGDRTVATNFGRLTLDEAYEQVSLGIAKQKAADAILAQVAEAKNEDWKLKGSYALWFKSTTDSFHFTMPRPSGNKLLWAGYLELEADGTPAENAKLTLFQLDNDNPDTLDISLTGLTANTSYALAIIEAPDLVIRPVNLTKYVTGDEVHEDGDYSNCFPDPRYTGIPDTAVIKVNGKEWIPAEHNNAPYPFDINYYELDENGNETLLKDDHAAGTYIAYIEPLAGLGAGLDQITINDQRLYFAPGELTILAVSNASGVENIENVASKVAYAEPSEAVEDAVAVIKDDTISFLVNGLKGQTPGEGADIRLLHDEILTGSEGGDTYAEMMIEKLRSSVTGLEDDPSGEPRQFAMKYLDFIDANDSNVIVTPDLGYSWQQKSYEIYLPYPSGTDKTFEFRVFDFQGLERSYTADDYGAGVGAAIENSTVQEFTDIERTDQGIKVTIRSGGRLGAMALSWQQKEYVIKAAAGEGGTISPSGDVRVRETADKTFTITPNAGYAVSDVKVDGKSIGAQTTYTFAGVTADHEILAEFARIRYTLTVENGSGDGTYPEGEKVTIKADKAPEGKVFAYWSSSAGGSFADEKAEQTVFTMPGGNVTVTAVYKDKAEPDKPGTGGDSGDSGSSGGSSGSTTELGGKTPHTGDSSNTVLWSVLAGGSLVGLAAAWLYFRKREN